ncbi:MAG TPA: ATP-binding protein [Thermoanaerobaculia bacterium]|nr:ATP-binding protein [Thermoanaerobaculia bacterium]HQN07063.1 ATP-binding protein [Thermoanaerobaculia bacterium]HQP85184.1 ATP-binding protein [Thermoanaerobaculia bacterium]
MTRPKRPGDASSGEFLAEAEMLLEEAGCGIDALDAEGDDPRPEKVNALFRTVHSLKGVAGMVGYSGIADAAHALEALLDDLRMGRVPPSPAVRGGVRDGLDALSTLVARVAAGEESPRLETPLKDRLEGLVRPAEPREAASLRLPPELDASLSDYERHRASEAGKRGKALVLVDLDLDFDSFDAGLRNAMNEASAAGELIGTFPGTAADPARMAFRLLVALPPGSDVAALATRCSARDVVGVSAGTAAPEPATEPVRLPATVVAEPAPPEPGPEAAPQVARGVVRVPLEKVAALVDLAGELALARSALGRTLGQALAGAPDRGARFEAQRAFARLDRLVATLGPAALALRLVPVETLTTRLARAFARTAAALGREADFVVQGVETEIDKVLADELGDPLLHILRNALDHGIESPEERAAAGKPRRGRVALTVAPRGREVVLTFSDDGRGVDAAGIVAKARQTGLLGPSDPDPAEPFALLFRAGFSTAREVSEISGRGVGLDVVREKLTALGGRVSVRSVPGSGTTFEVVVPMTLVLLESLVVRVGDVWFALPGENVRRTLQAAEGAIEVIDGRPCFRDGDEALPLARLDALFDLPRRPDAGGAEPVVVTEDGRRAAALVVDAVEGVWDLLVKPLADSVPRPREIAGAAEVPGGEIALALDAGALVARVHSASASGRRA